MNPSEVSLELTADPAFFTLARSVAEHAVVAMGLGEAERQRVGMATEEIFLCLCRGGGGADRRLVMKCQPGGSSVRIVFRFASRHFPLEYFNLTASVSEAEAEDTGGLGLLIASRLVDRFSVEHDNGDHLVLTLVKEKQYPPPSPDVVPLPPPPEGPVTVHPAAPEEAAHAAAQVAARYPAEALPRAFRQPRMFMDMLDFGETKAAVAVVADGSPVGLIAWHPAPGGKIMECDGPFVITRAPSTAVGEALLDFCIGDIAKLPVVGLVNRRPPPDIPAHYFEAVGSLPAGGPDGASPPVTALFRQMHEDPGSTVWAHERLRPFLEDQHRRLSLPRRIVPPEDRDAAPGVRTVLFTRFDRVRRTATLWPVVAGSDMAENLAAHLKLLADEAPAGVFFSLDLGRPWQAAFAPAVLDAGFTPRFILPYAGVGDLALFSL